MTDFRCTDIVKYHAVGTIPKPNIKEAKSIPEAPNT
jgi:hypothetical protein